MNKTLLTLSLLSLSNLLYSQENIFINLIFKDKDKLELTQTVDSDTHSNFFLLSKTAKWQQNRFVSKPDANEFDEMNIFADTTMRNLFSANEEQHFLEQAILFKEMAIKNVYKGVRVIDTVNKSISGYIIQVTSPVYARDSAYAIVDASLYLPIERDKTLKDSQIAQILFVFKRIKKDRWEIFTRRTKLLIW